MTWEAFNRRFVNWDFWRTFKNLVAELLQSGLSDGKQAEVRAFAALPEVCFIGEPLFVEQRFADWTMLRPGSAAHRWADAWIVAAAHA